MRSEVRNGGKERRKSGTCGDEKEGGGGRGLVGWGDPGEISARYKIPILGKEFPKAQKRKWTGKKDIPRRETRRNPWGEWGTKFHLVFLRGKKGVSATS